MNASVRAIDVDWDLNEGRARAPADDPRTLDLAGRLAHMLLNPISVIEEAAATLAPLSSSFVENMARHASFSRPVRRAVCSALGLDALTLPPDLLVHLGERASSRACVLLVTEPAAPVRSASLDLAAAILHRPIVAMILKADRTRIRLALGDERFLLATQEAPMLHPCLASLDDGERLNEVLRDAATASAYLMAFGLNAFRRFVETCEPSLRSLFDLRWSESGKPAACATFSLFTETHCDHFLKLLRRRTPPWSAIIG